MLLLGDGSIAHARVKLTYNGRTSSKYAAAINSDNNREQEKKIVAAVRRGLIQTATITIDEFLTKPAQPAPRNGTSGAWTRRALDAAQKILNRLDRGSRSASSRFHRPRRRVMPGRSRDERLPSKAEAPSRTPTRSATTSSVEVAGEAAPAILAGAIDGTRPLSTSDGAQARRCSTRSMSLLGRDARRLAGRDGARGDR